MILAEREADSNVRGRPKDGKREEGLFFERREYFGKKIVRVKKIVKCQMFKYKRVCP